MKKIHALFLTSSILLLNGCSSSGHLEKASPSFKACLGASHGGIIENTDLSLLESSPPDAYSGATKVGFHAGIHYEYPLQHISLETGIDGFLNSQTLSYQDDFAGFHGTRELMVSQLRIPLILNLRFLQEKQENGIIQLRLGLSPGFCFYGVDDHAETLPSYDKGVFTIGPLLGADFIPLRFKNGSALGISMELFRSFQSVYTDYYQVGETPGLSYLKFGLVYRLKK